MDTIRDKTAESQTNLGSATRTECATAKSLLRINHWLKQKCLR